MTNIYWSKHDQDNLINSDPEARKLKNVKTLFLTKSQFLPLSFLSNINGVFNFET